MKKITILALHLGYGGIENAVVLEKFESGCVYQIKTDKGTYKAFVPYKL